jgi:hypothetical protein
MVLKWDLSYLECLNCFLRVLAIACCKDQDSLRINFRINETTQLFYSSRACPNLLKFPTLNLVTLNPFIDLIEIRHLKVLLNTQIRLINVFRILHWCFNMKSSFLTGFAMLLDNQLLSLWDLFMFHWVLEILLNSLLGMLTHTCIVATIHDHFVHIIC